MSKLNIKLTSQEGVTLHTEGTYCEKSIAVIPYLESITVTPTTEVQNITPSEGYAGIGSVKVEASSGEARPYFDGTVVIKSANSVLGWRKLKESVTNVDITNISDQANLLDELGFVIEDVAVEDGYFINALTCTFFEHDGVTSIGVRGTYNGESEIIILPLAELVSVFSTFNVLSTSNSTVDEWLLNNTEPINLLGKRRFKETIELPEWTPDDTIDFYWDCDFTINGDRYTKMGLLGGSYSRLIFGYLNIEADKMIAAYFSDEGWQDEAYRTTELLTVPTNPEAVAWLLANTEEVSE